jgi:hypothetical protein
MSVRLGNIERAQAARVCYQVLDLTCAPDCVQPDFAVVSGHGAQAPQRIVQAIAVKDRRDCKRLVVGLSFAEMRQ